MDCERFAQVGNEKTTTTFCVINLLKSKEISGAAVAQELSGLSMNQTVGSIPVYPEDVHTTPQSAPVPESAAHRSTVWMWACYMNVSINTDHLLTLSLNDEDHRRKYQFKNSICPHAELNCAEGLQTHRDIHLLVLYSKTTEWNNDLLKNFSIKENVWISYNDMVWTDWVIFMLWCWLLIQK